jgi:hypothetical protein
LKILSLFFVSELAPLKISSLYNVLNPSSRIASNYKRVSHDKKKIFCELPIVERAKARWNEKKNEFFAL